MVKNFSGSAVGAAALPQLGVGVGLRPQIESHVREHASAVDWLEIITEDFLFTPHRQDDLAELRALFPLVPHGIELSIGSGEEPDPAYVDALAGLVEAVDAPWFSDHLCFTRAGGIALGALAPLLRTREVAETVARKAQQLQDRVGVPFLLENISTYIDIPAELSETEFLTHLLEHCDCGLLLDLTNVFNNSVNHGFDPLDFLDAVPLERVVQLHLAGGTWAGEILQDNHSADVHDEVWDLLRHVLAAKAPVKGILVERDGKLPDDFPAVLADVELARTVSRSTLQPAP